MIDGDGLSFSDIQLTQQKGAGITFYNTQNVSVESVLFANDAESWVRVLGPLSSSINLVVDGLDESKVQVTRGAASDAITW